MKSEGPIQYRKLSKIKWNILLYGCATENIGVIYFEEIKYELNDE